MAYSVVSRVGHDISKFLEIVKELNTKVEAKVEEIDKKLLPELASQSTGDLCPMQAVIGSMATQAQL